MTNPPSNWMGVKPLNSADALWFENVYLFYDGIFYAAAALHRPRRTK
jgi:hypothetical protein